MKKPVNDYSEIEKIITFIAEQQSSIKPEDKLTEMLNDKFSDYFGEELSEEELEFATAAKMPDIPKYKITEKM